MKKIATLLLVATFVLPSYAQEDDKNANEKTNLKTTRQGFGNYRGIDMSLGFVNADMKTDGTPYYFDNWDTDGLVYIKDKGRIKIDKVNINLYDNTLEALYEETKVFTFDSDNLMKIVINGKDFRTFEVDNQIKILELFYKGKISVYRYFDVSYSRGSVDPMKNRQRNKYIKNDKYYIYNNGKLDPIKMTKKSIAKKLMNDSVSEDDIAAFIKENRLSLKKEDDLVEIFEFVSK